MTSAIRIGRGSRRRRSGRGAITISSPSCRHPGLLILAKASSMCLRCSRASSCCLVPPVLQRSALRRSCSSRTCLGCHESIGDVQGSPRRGSCRRASGRECWSRSASRAGHAHSRSFAESRRSRFKSCIVALGVLAQAISSPTETAVTASDVVICWPGLRRLSRPSAATRTAPSTTETREPFVPALTEKMVPLTATEAVVGADVQVSTSPAARRLDDDRAATETNRRAVAPLGERAKLGPLAHLDARARRPSSTKRPGTFAVLHRVLSGHLHPGPQGHERARGDLVERARRRASP